MRIAPTFTALSILSNFAPWIVYGVLSAVGQTHWSYVGGWVVAVSLSYPGWRASRFKILDVVTALFFFAGLISTWVFHSSFFPRHSSVLIWSTFAVVAWGSLIAGSPFTAQYGREVVPKEFWDKPGFRRVNAIVTAVWGGVFVVNTVLAAVMVRGSLGHAQAWVSVVPYVCTAFGVVFTNRYPRWAARQTGVS